MPPGSMSPPPLPRPPSQQSSVSQSSSSRIGREGARQHSQQDKANGAQESIGWSEGTGWTSERPGSRSRPSTSASSTSASASASASQYQHQHRSSIEQQRPLSASSSTSNRSTFSQFAPASQPSYLAERSTSQLSNSNLSLSSSSTSAASTHTARPTPTDEAAFRYDSLLGPRPNPPPPHTISPPATSRRSFEQHPPPPPPNGMSHYGQSSSVHHSLDQERAMSPHRRVEYEEDGGERVARAMMQGLGLSTGQGDSRGGSPLGQTSLESEEERQWLATQHGQHPPGSAYFAAASRAGSDPTLSGHPSTSSLGSSATASSAAGNVMSPLSPLVEPFSPATSAQSGTSGGAWSVREREPSNLDLRTFQQQQQQQQQQQHLSHPSLTRSDFTQSPVFQSTSQGPHPYFSHDRAAALATLQGANRPPSDYSSPILQPHGHFSSDESLVGGGGSSSSAGMSSSLSREGFPPATAPPLPGQAAPPNPVAAAAIFGLAARREREREREIPTDRGGYVRAGYAEASARGALGAAASGVAPAQAAAAAAALGTSSPALGTGSAGTQTPEGQEEISTIFVVGFPEDMLEREFQNMFVFATGFQAATLKIPASTIVARERERELAAISSAVGVPVGGVSIAGAGVASASPYQSDPYESMGGYEDAFGNNPLSPGGAGGIGIGLSVASDPSSLASVLGPLVARDQAGSPAGARKQIIGFAKFNTRAQALDARDMLSGKKVDAEKGNVLKAEMAKKNLHTKRGLSNELAPGGPGGAGPSFPLSALDQATLARLATAGNLSPAVLAELARQTAASQVQQQPTQQPVLHQPQPQQEASRQSAAFEAFHSIPTPAPQHQQQQQPRQGDSSLARNEGSKTEGSGSARADYLDDSGSSGAVSGGWARHRGYSRERTTSASPDYQQPLEAPHSPHSASSSPHMRSAVQPGLGGGYGGKSMLQQLDEGRQTAFGAPVSSSTQQSFSDSPYEPNPSFDEPTPMPPPTGMGTSFSQQQQQSSYQLASPVPRGSYGAPFGGSAAGGPMSPTVGPEGSSNGAAIPRTQNPADMNAPKNTLYVGGLPAVLPSLTGPFSAAHLEDSLRNAFSRCPGFRRLSFRSKSNGPIVFVEFDDVMYATRALTEMYGNTLGGVVKGGIRLSYSKNPLGVRSGSGSVVNVSNGVSHQSSPALGGPPQGQVQGVSYPSESMYGGGSYGHSPGSMAPAQPQVRPSESVFGDFRSARSPPVPYQHQQLHPQQGEGPSTAHYPPHHDPHQPRPPSAFGGFSPFSS